TLTMAQGLPNNWVFSTVEDRDGNLWFATNGGGISRYDGEAFKTYTTVQGLSNNRVFSITEDKEDKLWLGTNGGGVCLLPLGRGGETVFCNWTQEHGLPNNTVWSLQEDKQGSMWMGTDGGGVCRYSLPSKPGDKASFTTYTTRQGLASNTIFCMCCERNGDLWFGTSGAGVSHFDGHTFVNYSTSNGLGSNGINAIIQDKDGNIWFGTQGGGISCIPKGLKGEKPFVNFTTAQGLCANEVNAVYEDNAGNLWFGTGGGGISVLPASDKLALLAGDKSSPPFINLGLEDGLPDGQIYSIIQDKEGRIWAGTNLGLAGIVFRNAPGHTVTGNLPLIKRKNLEHAGFEVFNIKNGYPVKDVSFMFCDSKNIIWAGTGDRLVRFNPHALNRSIVPPELVIQNIQINGKNVNWYSLQGRKQGKYNAEAPATASEEFLFFGKSLSPALRDSFDKPFMQISFEGINPFYPLPENLCLPYENNDVTFEFNAIEPSRPYLVSYEYILEGYTNAWSPVSQQTRASFGNIREGRYTFKVRARSPEGVWSPVVMYSFRVSPPWFRTWWAYSLEAILIFALLFGLYRWRTAALLKEKRILELKVEHRTAEVVEQKELAELGKKEAERQKDIADSQRVIAEELRVVAEKQKNEVEEKRVIIEEKQKEILDSIHYARRIQQALLTSESYFNKHLPDEHFLLFKPKDIVSGDFYWALHTPPAPGKDGRGLFFVATADCTGHGVPGAFMSMLNISFLNEIVMQRGTGNPAEVLNLVRAEIIHALNPEGSEEEARDGMDAVLCCYDFDAMSLHFAGANNAIWLWRKGVLTHYKGDKMPVGKYHDETKSFTLHTIPLEKGDIVYSTTDGYPDQFGGPRGKKFKYKHLEEVILSYSRLPMKEQHKRLSEVFEDWKGKLEQIDDVTIIGIRI
ncbi:MAG: two-component regulator propeller domain-containing protein, partial [Bacteroidia bacterium]